VAVFKIGNCGQTNACLLARGCIYLGLAVIILVVMTIAAPPHLKNDTAAPIPSSVPIYRAQYLNLY
jgi:hypothetical protein